MIKKYSKYLRVRIIEIREFIIISYYSILLKRIFLIIVKQLHGHMG